MDQLREYQKRAIAWGREHDKGFFAIDMGLGKTAILCHLLNEKEVTLVVAPLRVATITWPEELQKWRPDLTFKVLHGDTRQLVAREHHHVYIINYEGLKWLNKQSPALIKRFVHGTLVLDESTFLKGHSSVRTQLLFAMRPVFKRIYCLSGSPIGNHIQGLWPQYYMLDEGAALGENITTFRKRYCDKHPNVKFAFIPKPNAVDDIAPKVAPLTFRLNARDYLELNEPIYMRSLVKLPKETMLRYKQLLKDLVTEIRGSQVVVNGRGAAAIKVRQLLQGGVYDKKRNVLVDNHAKLDALAEKLEALDGEPVIVCIQFRSELEAIMEKFPYAKVIIGGTPAGESARIISAWNKRQVPLLVVHPRSLSHGLNMQFGGHHIIWLGLEWSLETYQQLNGRLQRMGQTKTCVIDHIVADSTIDTRILASLQANENLQQLFLGLLNEEIEENSDD